MTETRLDTITAPYGREVRLDEVPFESGMRLLRITIREGRRFTVLDLDAESAAQVGAGDERMVESPGRLWPEAGTPHNCRTETTADASRRE